MPDGLRAPVFWSAPLVSREPHIEALLGFARGPTIIAIDCGRSRPAGAFWRRCAARMPKNSSRSSGRSTAEHAPPRSSTPPTWSCAFCRTAAGLTLSAARTASWSCARLPADIGRRVEVDRRRGAGATVVHWHARTRPMARSTLDAEDGRLSSRSGVRRSRASSPRTFPPKVFRFPDYGRLRCWNHGCSITRPRYRSWQRNGAQPCKAASSAGQFSRKRASLLVTPMMSAPWC